MLHSSNTKPKVLRWVADLVRSRFLTRLLSLVGTTGPIEQTFQGVKPIHQNPTTRTPATSFLTYTVRVQQRVDTSRFRIPFRCLVQSISATLVST